MDRAYRDGRLVMDSKQDLVDEIDRLQLHLDSALKLNEPIRNELARVDAENERLWDAVREACDLLAERTQGSAARSPGHNARLRLESALRQADD